MISGHSPAMGSVVSLQRRSNASLRARLICWNAIAIALLLGGLGIVSRLFTHAVLIRSVDQQLDLSVEMYRHPPRFQRRPPLRAAADGLRQGIWPPGAAERPLHSHRPLWDRGDAPPQMPKMMRPPDVSGPYRTHFYDSRGQTIMPDDLRTPWDAEALARALHGETLHTTVLIAGEPVRILSTCGYNPMGTSGVIQKGYALKELYRLLATLDLALLLLIPVGLGAAGWLGTALTNQVLRRVHHMTQAAADFGAADFSRRLPVSGNDEFAALAQTFNNLLGGLDRVFQDQQQALQRQQRFIADASHELKTPLTVIRGRASLAQGRTSTDLKSRHAFHEIDTAAISMSRLVQDLLLLARSDEDRMAQDLGLLSVRALLESARDQAACEERAPMFIEVDGESLSVRGNETELVRLFRNLLDNAVRYTPPNGTIQVRARSLGDQVVVTVTDTGVGIAPEHLPHLGERFYRVDASRTRPTGGTGLGLSICREVVQAHHGTMSFQSAPGIGTTVTVTLPLPLLTD